MTTITPHTTAAAPAHVAAATAIVYATDPTDDTGEVQVAMSDNDSDGDDEDDDNETCMYIKLENYDDNETITFPLVLIEGIIFCPRTHEASTIQSIQTSVHGASAATELSWPVVSMTGHFKALVMLPRPGTHCIDLAVHGEVVHTLTVNYKRPVTKHFARFHYEKQASDTRGFDAPAGMDNSTTAALKRVQLGALLTQTRIAELFHNQGFPRATIALEFAFDETAACEMPIVIVLEPTVLATGGLLGSMRDALHGQNAASNATGVTFRHFVHVGSNHYDPETRSTPGHCTTSYDDAIYFSSTTLYAWPSALCDVIKCLLDTTIVDESMLGNDSGGRESYWGNFATGLGVFMYFFFASNSPRRSSRGMLCRGFDNTNRILSVYEPAAGADRPAIVPHGDAKDGAVTLDYSVLETVACDLQGAYVVKSVLRVLLEQCEFISCASKMSHDQAVAAGAA